MTSISDDTLAQDEKRRKIDTNECITNESKDSNTEGQEDLQQEKSQTEQSYDTPKKIDTNDNSLINKSKDSITDWSADLNQENRQTIPIVHIGAKIAKKFPGHGLYYGTVTTYFEEDGFWRIVYDDNDEEDMDQEEILKGMVLFNNDTEKRNKRQSIEPRRSGRVRVSTPSTSTETRLKANASSRRKRYLDKELSASSKNSGMVNEIAPESHSKNDFTVIENEIAQPAETEMFQTNKSPKLNTRSAVKQKQAVITQSKQKDNSIENQDPVTPNRKEKISHISSKLNSETKKTIEVITNSTVVETLTKKNSSQATLNENVEHVSVEKTEIVTRSYFTTPTKSVGDDNKENIEEIETNSVKEAESIKSVQSSEKVTAPSPSLNKLEKKPEVLDNNLNSALSNKETEVMNNLSKSILPREHDVSVELQHSANATIDPISNIAETSVEEEVLTSDSVNSRRSLRSLKPTDHASEEVVDDATFQQTPIKRSSRVNEDTKSPLSSSAKLNPLDFLHCDVAKHFRGIGKFCGSVVKYIEGDEDNEDLWRIVYEDGDEEDMNLAELREAIAYYKGNINSRGTSTRERKRNKKTIEDSPAEKLLGRRFYKGEEQYLVKWKGLAQEASTWVPATQLNCPLLLIEFHRK